MLDVHCRGLALYNSPTPLSCSIYYEFPTVSYFLGDLSVSEADMKIISYYSVGNTGQNKQIDLGTAVSKFHEICKRGIKTVLPWGAMEENHLNDLRVPQSWKKAL